MAETIVENQICSTFSADVREGALFCYNCGGGVASKIVVAINDKIETVDNVQFQENISKESENGTEFKQSELEIKQEVREISVENPIAQPIEKLNSSGETKLKTAATMRGKPKIIQPKKIEVIWKEHENTPNIWFIFVAVFLTIVSAIILFLAMRMK